MFTQETRGQVAPVEYSGIRLQKVIKGQLEKGLIQAEQMQLPEMTAFITALQDNFSIISSSINWNISRDESEIQAFFGASVGAIHLARNESGHHLESLYGLADKKEWSKVIQTTLAYEKTKQIFVANIWRSPMIVNWGRSIGLQYILKHHFGENPIRGIDLGAGLHIALPLLNSDFYKNAVFPGKKKIARFSGPVNIQRGVGIDKQDRSSSLLWAQSCYWPLKENAGSSQETEKIYTSATQRSEQFPFIQANVLTNECHKQALQLIEQTEGADFIFSSFVRHQLGESTLVQEQFVTTVSKLLRNDGIWVDLGSEMITSEQYISYGMRVYQKVDEHMELRGTPFRLKKQSNIEKTDLQYFETL